jgi:hypothetical protein
MPLPPSPPAPVITGPVLRATMFGRCNGQICENTHDYMARTMPLVTSTSMAAFAAGWTTTIEAAYQTVVPASDYLLLTTVACISLNTLVTITTAVNLAGLVAGNSLPIEMAAVVSRYSALKGKHGRGRFFAFGVPILFTTPASDPNLLNGAGIANYQGLGTSLLGPFVLGGVTWDPVISTRPVTPLVVVSRAAVVTSYFPQPLLGTVRRRREGRGI